MGHAVRRPYSDSEDSDNDVLHADEHDSAVQWVNLRKEWSTQTIVDSCGDGCAHLDDFKWFLPTDVRVGELNALESEIETSDSESGVDFIEPDSTSLQKETTTQQLLCPPVVAQTRPMEGCHAAVPRRLRRGRDVQTMDDAVPVDARQVHAASDGVVSQKIHRKSECVMTLSIYCIQMALETHGKTKVLGMTNYLLNYLSKESLISHIKACMLKLATPLNYIHILYLNYH